MNWFTDSGIIGIKYNGKAVDMQGNIIGNVMTGDYGYVAGRYEGEDDWGHKYIDAQIIILDSAEQNAQKGYLDKNRRSPAKKCQQLK